MSGMKNHVIIFSERFVQKVVIGSKLQTIRPARKRQICPGDQLSLRRWTGLPYRSKQVLLTEALATGSQEIVIASQSLSIGSRTWVWSCEPGRVAMDDFAKKDGFDFWADLTVWFANRYPLPFHGVLIEWILR